MTSGKFRLASLRKGRHKLIHRCLPEETRELFDLESDPKEQRSLAGADPARTRELFEELSVILGGDPCEVMTAAVRGVAPTVGLDAESIEALRALGYLEK